MSAQQLPITYYLLPSTCYQLPASNRTEAVPVKDSRGMAWQNQQDENELAHQKFRTLEKGDSPEIYLAESLPPWGRNPSGFQNQRTAFRFNERTEMKKIMYEVTVSVNAGNIEIGQPDPFGNDSDVVVLHSDQIGTIIAWLSEARADIRRGPDSRFTEAKVPYSRPALCASTIEA